MRREEGEVGPLQPVVLLHVLVDQRVRPPAVEHVPEVVAVEHLQQGDAPVAGVPGEGHDQQEVGSGAAAWKGGEGGTGGGSHTRMIFFFLKIR